MSNDKERMDFYSGVPWVNVTPEQARGHPKGQLHWLLWLIVLYFIGTAVVKFAVIVPDSFYFAVLNSIWPLAAGIGLAIRAPWSVIMAIVSAGLTVWLLVRGLGSDGSLFYLLETLANVGILFYLMDGDRPNLIYRHRYRKYSVQQQGDDDAAE